MAPQGNGGGRADGGARVHVVGAGPSALHFAQSALDSGMRVTLLDVGHEPPPVVAPELSFAGLKRELPDPAEYFLGDDYSAVLFPGDASEYYGFPPGKAYVFEGVPGFRWNATGFAPLFSFAQGGLAQAWTGGAFPFSAAELADFPFGYDELRPYYDLVAARIGVNGAEDDLARWIPVHAHLEEPLPLDEHGAKLHERYLAKRDAIRGMGVALGRTRSATLTRDRDGRPACNRSGRCLWGCPTHSLYTPRLTLLELRERDGFEYLPDRRVTHFESSDGVVRRVVARRADGEVEHHDVDRLVLAAGTLSSCGIWLESLRRAGEPVPRLEGLMDNRQVLVPFVNLAMLRRPYEPSSFQYHQLALGFEGASEKEYVHGLVTTLKTALIHPIVQNVPFDLRTAVGIFRNVHAALGLVNVNLHDDRRASSWVGLEDGPDDGGGGSRLRVHYEPSPAEPANLRRALRTTKQVLRKLGCIVPPGMMHVRPMGASVHYAGLLPMTAEDRPCTTTPDGRARGHENLWFVDGTGFPFLPAKNLTFTLMANAARVADAVARGA